MTEPRLRGERLYRLAIRGYPRPFREEYRGQLIAAFRDRARRESSRGGWGWRWRLWLVVAPDLCLSLVGEWSAHLRAIHRFRGRRGLPRGLGQDVRLAFRSLRRQPGFTAVAVLILGLGIGANTAIFTVVHDLILRPLPFAGADRIVYLLIQGGNGEMRATPAGSVIAQWRERATSFDAIETYQSRNYSLTGEGTPELLEGIAVAPTLFSSFGVTPLLGRVFTADDGTAGATSVAVLSETLWQRRFGRDPAVIGRTLVLDDTTHTVVGVIPSNFGLALTRGLTQIWTPHDFVGSREAARTSSLNAMARLASGVTLETARAELAGIGLPEGDRYARWSPSIDRPASFLGSNFSQGMWVLFGAVGLVLLIACANVANMISARSTARVHEIGLRSALGATRGRVFRLLVIEASLVAAGGAVAGLLLAQSGLGLIKALRPDRLDALRYLSLDWVVLAFAAGATVLVTAAVGILPGLHFSRLDTASALRLGPRGGRTTGGQATVRQWLVAGEAALALMVCVGAGLLVRSFAELSQIDPGFQSNNLGTLSVDLPPGRYPTVETRAEYHRTLRDALVANPDVERVALAGAPPGRFSANFGSPLLEGHDPPQSSEMTVTAIGHVSPEYFAVVGTRILEGRSFIEEDARQPASPVIVNHAFVRRYWPNTSPLQSRIRFRDDAPWHTIVGVVNDIKAFGLNDESDRLQLYYPIGLTDAADEDAHGSMAFIVRGRRPFAELVPGIRSTAAGVDAEIPLRRVIALDQILAGSISRQRFTASLFAVFAVLALALAGAGTYGVVALLVRQRAHDAGIRLALGAGRGRIIRWTLAMGIRPVVLGIAVGLVAAWYTVRFLESLLHGVNARDPVTMVLVPALLATVAILACLAPARTAASVDPVKMLKSE